MNSIDLMMNDANESVGGSVGRAIDAVGGAIKSAAKKVWEFLKNVARWIADKIKWLAGKIKDIATGAWVKFTGVVKTFCGFVKAKATALWGWIMKTVKAAKDKTGDALANAKAKVKELTTSLKDKLADRAALKTVKKAAKQAAKNGMIPPDILQELKSMDETGVDIVGKLTNLDVPEEAKDVVVSALATLRSIGTAAADLADVSEGGSEGDNTPETPSADSMMEQFTAAREAAKNGDLEGAIESLIGALGGQNTATEPTMEEMAMENTLLELELLDV